MYRKSWPIRTAIILLTCGTWVSGQAAAQSPATGTAADERGPSPISCWWKADKTGVRVGEAFGLTLTCRVLETERAVVVPNVTNIEPTSLQLTPYDVIEGTRHEDIVMPPWRYIQFIYTVRLLGEEFFGRDISIPATNVTFRVQTGAAETIEGAEQTYVLPSLPMRILSLLPAPADDIRDSSLDTFGDIESRRFQSTVGLVGGAICFGFAGVLLIIAAVRGVERFRNRGPALEPTVPARTLLRGCLHEINRVRSEAAREGWNPGLAGRVLAPFRIAGAIALSQPLTQKFVSGDAATHEGQLSVRHGILRRRHALVSAATTADAIDRLQASGNGNRPWSANPETVGRIRDVLAGLNAVRYGRSGTVDVQEIDRLLENGAGALRRLRVASLLPMRAAKALVQSAATLGIGTWRH